MNIRLLTIGKTHTKYIQEGIGEYLKRLRYYIPFEIVELPDARISSKSSESQQKEKEADIFLDKISPSDCVVILDERGKELTSVDFSKFIEKNILAAKKSMVFLIGGPYGFSSKIYERADHKISLSKMTFTHEMVRLFIAEQIYRAMTIMRGESYHH